MKEWIRNWLGLTEMFDREVSIIMRLQKIHDMSEASLKEVRILGPSLGRIIAKLDPQYGKSEFDPIRKDESQALAEDIIKRLRAEDAARRHTTGES